MIVVISSFLLRKGFNGITLWPFVILRHKTLRADVVLVNHERIHLRQQLELLIIFFYCWYLAEYVVRLFQYKDRRTAYRNISFEREAYAHEKDLDYLKKRPFWKFLKYKTA